MKQSLPKQATYRDPSGRRIIGRKPTAADAARTRGAVARNLTAAERVDRSLRAEGQLDALDAADRADMAYGSPDLRPRLPSGHAKKTAGWQPL